MDVRVVHVIFKTHLDLGYTDFAGEVLRQYQQHYIPRAMQLARELAERGGQARFVWTTGSWLIDRYLRDTPSASQQELEDAIRQGMIAWHALPFTTHTELMNASLVQHGLSISQRLDARFGTTTVAAKMTDVPGHTIALVPWLAAAGVKFLHIGVNPASPRPTVPDVFVWRADDGSEIIVNYSDTYGDWAQIDGFDEVMVFCHTGDNDGPPTADTVVREFARLARQFPHADIRASTMDAYARQVWAIRDRLPVVCEEIGDTWIHGIASDPKKIAEYRALLRFRERCVRDGRWDANDADCLAMADSLLLVPEHTWGLDIKTYLGDMKNYSKSDFQAARLRDVVTDDAIPDEFEYIGRFALSDSPIDEVSHPSPAGSEPATLTPRTYSRVEASWDEQRAYVRDALKEVPAALRDEAQREMDDLVAQAASVEGMSPLRVHEVVRLGTFTGRFGPDGALWYLQDSHGRVWVDENQRFGVCAYDVYGEQDYQRFIREYIVNKEQTHAWANADFGKPGFAYAGPPERKVYTALAMQMFVGADTGQDRVVCRVELPQEAYALYGGARRMEVVYEFPHDQSEFAVAVSWFDKDPMRLPEATWFSMQLRTANPHRWRIDKLGLRINPFDVVDGGNRAMHAVDRGVWYDAADGQVSIESLDAPLVRFGTRELLTFDRKYPAMDGGMHFNLHNNVWGTNFPAWFGGDAKFRFRIRCS